MNKRNRKKTVKAAERLERELRRFSDVMKTVHKEESMWLGEQLATVLSGAHLLSGQVHALTIDPHKYFVYWGEKREEG